jgi:UDP-N-acetylmuramoyl-L-alanyl-D-glutamate--2,6-diaminopimelate ligase
MNPQMPKPLALLLAGAGDSSLTGNPDVTISSIAVDSRRVEPGALFVCLKGQRFDGHDHAPEAVARGAAAVLAEREVEVGTQVTVARVASTLRALSPIAAALYDRPSEALTVVGVTGTNGKTTTTHFIESIAAAAGNPFGLIGTLGARLRGSFESPLEHTTPFAHDVQRLLAAFRDAHAGGAILEVSSHALALHRVDDVAFDVATFTNLTQDHLDFHATFDAYRDAKRSLFDATARSGGVAVVNADDPEGDAVSRSVTRRLTYGVNNKAALLKAADVEYATNGSTFAVKSVRPARFAIQLPGPFNVSNAMAALATAVALDIDVEAIAEGLAGVASVPGRMTQVPAGDVSVYVDYAHTPDGLKHVLQAARALAKGRLICVFGCGGDRDTTKRPEMGRIAREASDVTIVTSDNPRYEDPAKIIDDVVSGVAPGQRGNLEVIPDRAAAIERAIETARPGDVVVIAGKGHEAYQLVGGERRPFSDVEAARAAIDKVRA